MRFGVNTWVWASPLGDSDLAELAPKVAEFGFDSIELPIETPGDFDYARAGAIVCGAGLQVSVAAAMGPDRDLIHPDENIRTNGMAYVRHCIDAAHTIGATNLIGPIYAAVGRTWQATAEERERDIMLLAAQLRSLAEYAADRGVVLCIEPLNRFETSVINLARQGIEVIERVDHPSCRLMLDTFHMMCHWHAMIHNAMAWDD